MLESILKRLPVPMEGDPVTRREPCRCCGEKTGVLISQIDYWDITSADIVKCVSCGTAQLDPMLTDAQTAKGCLAYYIEESLRNPVRDQKRNALRNFRRGVHFAYTLRHRGYSPAEVLELGPGSGFFLLGVQYVFPEAKAVVLDANDEVLRSIREQHGYETHHTTPEHLIRDLQGRFDLVVARDILEHVTDIGAVIRNVGRYLKGGGLFHFITPNGHEDSWRFYIRHRRHAQVSELLINHVNYFDGKGLAEHLLRERFREVSYYTYKLTTTLRGRGRRIHQSLMAPVSCKRSAEYYISQKMAEVRAVDLDKTEILDRWYLKPGRRLLARLVSWYMHSYWITVDPRISVGHEIFGLFEKM